MTTGRVLSLLALGALALACRNPQDPTRAPVLVPDGGPAPPAPDIQPDTGKPIGPVAGETPLQIPPPPSAGAGGRGPSIGSGGFGGVGAVPGQHDARAAI